MKYFQKIAEGVDVLPLLHAAHRQADLWNENPIRTKHPGTAHANVSDILLRFNDVGAYLKSGDPKDIVNDREVLPCRAWDLLPQARAIVFDLMRRVEAVQLGRVIITKLPPGKEITPHVDGGAPATWYERYQVALQSLPGALFKIGDETVNFRAGEVWHVNNCILHSVHNNSADDRVVMIVDLRLR